MRPTETNNKSLKRGLYLLFVITMSSVIIVHANPNMPRLVGYLLMVATLVLAFRYTLNLWFFMFERAIGKHPIAVTKP